MEVTGTILGPRAEIARLEETDGDTRRLGQELEHRATNLVALDRACRALTTSLDPEGVLRLLMSEVRALLGVEGATVLQYDPDSDELVFVAAGGTGLERLIGQRLPSRAGIVGWVFNERRAAVIQDLRSDPQFVDPLDGLTEIGLRSMLAVPLISKGTLIGVLGTINKIGSAFSSEDLQSLTAMATAAAIALENARLFATEQARRKQLEAVRAVSDEITRELDLSRVLGLITQHAGTLIGAGPGRVWLWDEEAQALIAQVLPGRQDRGWVVGRRLRLGEGLVGLVAERRKGWIVNDYRGWPQALPFILERGTITAAVAEPLLYRDRLLGVVVIDNEGTERTFSREDSELLGLFASHAAIAIQNAQLFEEVQAARGRLERLSRQLVEVQEAERRHIARELHDEVGQTLTGLKLLLDMRARVMPNEERESQGDAQALVNELVSQVCELSLDLRPAMLDDLGLLPTLLWYFERYRSRTGVQAIFKQVGLENRRFAAEVETAAYRIVQEALTNVARHANVVEVTVRAWAGAETLGVQIEDQGVGFNPEVVLAENASSGLAGMRERAGLLNGRVTLESTPGRGACVTAEFPLGSTQGRTGSAVHG